MVSYRFPVLCLLFSSFIGAQVPERVHFVRASGDATVTAKPDRAEITIGVTTRANTAAEASARNASQSTEVLKAMETALGSAGKVKTTGFSINAQYDYSNNHAPKLTGYECSNTVLVTVDDLSRVGKVIDAATASGANNINGIAFTLRDDSGPRAEALAAAAVKARANAEAIAKALNLRVGAVLQAQPEETPNVVRPAFAMRAMSVSAAPAPTPIEAGDLTIHAAVTVTLEVN
jgi:uncharacterized protein